MDDYPGGWACYQWYWRTPLSKQWAKTSDEFRERVLSFWIRASEYDKWTYLQLRELFAELDASGSDIPPVLQAWVNDGFLGRHETKVRRPTDPQGDTRTLMAEMVLCALFGWSKRRAHREIAEMRFPMRANDGTTTGREQIRPPGTVEASARRARRRPPGA